MRIDLYGDPSNFYDNAFYNYDSDDFDVELISASSTKLVVENTATGARTVMNGSGIVAGEYDIRGTLSSVEFYDDSGARVATFTELNWGLRNFIEAIDEELVEGNTDPLAALLGQGGGLIVDASEATTEIDFSFDELGIPVTYIAPEGDDESGDDTPDAPVYQTIFPDGFDASTAPEEGASIYRIYQATLDRAPDIGGFNNWTERLLTGDQTLQDIASGFVASQEFQNTYGALDDAGFVNLLYQNVLDRDADTGGLNNWIAQLDSGMSRAEVVTGFSNSVEFIEATHSAANSFANATSQASWTDDVYRLYQATLDRAPDFGGLTNWTEELAGGRDFTSVINGFVASQEFQNTYGTLDDAGFVNQLYHNVLDRGADANGLSNWVTKLNEGMSRAEVVEGFAQSSEFRASTDAALADWMSWQTLDDVIEAPEGQSLLAGGFGPDVFVFDTQAAGDHRVLDLEPWDTVYFESFGYASESELRSHMEQSGNDVLFSDQGVNITFENTQLGALDNELVFYG